MTWPLIAVLAVLALLPFGMAGVLWALRTRLEPPPRQPADDVTVRLVALETAVRGLPSLWELERKRVEEIAALNQRSAARVERANQRAQAKRAESADESGALYPALHVSDGSGSGEARVPTVPTRVAAPVPPDFSAVTGVRGR